MGDPVNHNDPKGLYLFFEDDGEDPTIYDWGVVFYSDPPPAQTDPVPTDPSDPGDPIDPGSSWIFSNKEFQAPILQYVLLSPQAERSLLNAAEQLALKALDDPKCAGLFNTNGEGPDPETLLQDLISGNGGYGSTSYGRLAWDIWATTSPTAPVKITLNDNANGPWANSSAAVDAATLLHELGHAYTVLWGAGASAIALDNKANDPHWGTPNSKSIQNQNTITSNCVF
jgi:hypothetical protein